jgi:hypothetical protein
MTGPVLTLPVGCAAVHQVPRLAQSVLDQIGLGKGGSGRRRRNVVLELDLLGRRLAGLVGLAPA